MNRCDSCKAKNQCLAAVEPAVRAFDREEDFWAAIRAADEG